MENSKLVSVLCSHLKIPMGKKRVLCRAVVGEAAAVGTVESENLLLERGKENFVCVKMGNINPVIFFFLNSIFPLHASFSCPSLLLSL